MSELVNWLEALGLGKYAANFADNEVEYADLAELSDEDLKDIGLPLGPRRRILKALRSEADHEPATVAVEDGADQPVEHHATAERRQLTVMFCDLAGSTALSTRLDPEDYREAIRAYQDVCAGIIARYDGYVAKFMGDGVLAYFGWPHGHENEAERALSAGLGLVDAVSQIELAGGETEHLKVRIGIATGPVVVGDIIGEGAAQEAAVTGETPNLAARLQELAEPNSVAIAKSTQLLAGGLFDYVSLGSKKLKGITEPIEVFRVTGQRSVESRYEARGSQILPMVGRDQELALLLERWTQVDGSEGQGVLLVGEAGIGKSRIVGGLIDSLASQAHTRIRYQCSPFHAGSAFWPVVQQLRHAAGIEARDDPAAQLEKLEKLLLATHSSEQDISLLADLLGLDESPQYRRLDLTPPVRRERTLEALINQLTELAAHQPVLVVFEDTHWIDPTTLEMLERSLDVIADCSVMVLLTSRPDNQPELAGHPHVTRLTLNRLGRAGLKDIIERLGGEGLPQETIETIIARTDGVPLFVEELTKAVLETGETTIPASLHDSLMSRLDRFPDVKEVAQAAACIGREFDFPLLAQIVDRKEPELASALDRLIAAELVFRRGSTAAGGFIFKHALVRDAAYESLLKRKRQDLHGRLVKILEQQEDVIPEVLARHAEAAGMAVKAIEHWSAAAALAMERPAYKEAISSFQAAIHLIQGFEEGPEWQHRELELQVKLGQALIAHLGYQAPATMNAFERALELAEVIGEAQLLVPSLFGLWASRYISNKPSLEIANRLAEIVATTDDDGAKCISARMLALERFHMTEYRQSLELVERALNIYDESRHRDLAFSYGHDPRVAATNYKAWNLWHLGYMEQAQSAAEASLDWARQTDHPNTIGLSLCYGVCLTNIWLGDFNRVREAAEETLSLSEEKSLALWDAWGRIYLGWAVSKDVPGDGIEHLLSGLEAARQIGAARLEAFHLSLAADAQSASGRHDDADRLFASAFAVLKESSDKPFASDIHRLRALALTRKSVGLTDEAQRELLRAIEIARDQQALSLELRAMCDLAVLWADAGERNKARDWLKPLRARFTEGAGMPDLAKADKLLANLG
ncbi:adenylate/guanylate cyclase domain-containing protein [Hoeflea sp. TYP-13]|uniref:adenylate/guanylate cyclase domain-containing protein n=1 Tax=Hoeflea sp. TYP-13 TaxID=3230023 RepID=UPI0034C5DA5F